MHKLVTEGPGTARVAIVETRKMRGLWDSGVSTITEELLSATFAEFGMPWEKVDRYSLGFTEGAPVLQMRRELSEKLNRYDVVIALGGDAVKALCKTTRPLKDYAGCMTEFEGTWVIPTWHPSVVADGNYDAFDDIYNHVKRAVDLVNGELNFPDGKKLDWEFIGHNGERGEDHIWSGYSSVLGSEAVRAREVISKWLENPPAVFGADTESYNTDFFKPLTMVQLYDGEKGYAFNYGVLNHPSVRPLFVELFSNTDITFVWHNYKHDAKMLRHWFGIPITDNNTDTMMYALGLTEKGRQCGLKYLSRQWCNAPFYDEGLDDWFVYPPGIKESEKKHHKNYGHIRPDVLAEYGCLDVFYAYELYHILPPLCEKEGTLDLVHNTLLPATYALADIEYEGIEVDLDYAKEQSAEWEPLIEEGIKAVQDYAASLNFPQDMSLISGQRYKTICECVPVRAQFHLQGVRVLSYRKTLREKGFELPECDKCDGKRYITEEDRTLNVTSWKHMHHLCFDMLNMQMTHKGRSTNQEFWELNEDHPLSELVQEYKDRFYVRRNILEGVQRFVREDGKVHPDFLLFGTKTGRLAIHDPAMQTIPSRGILAKIAKKIFKAEPGHVIVNGDYKSLEMFVNAYLTGDKQLLDDLLTKDLYKATAMDMYQVPYEEVTDEMRTTAKPVVLGSGYGIGAKKLANNPKLEKVTQGDPEVAQRFLDAFWGRYSTWKEWCEKQHETVFSEGRLTTEFGRVRRWNLITDDNQWSVRNQAQNFPGQSVGTDICLTALVKLHKELKDRGWGRVILSVHDAIVASIKEEHIHEAVALMKEIMENPPMDTGDVPFRVDFELGRNYGEKEDYDPQKDYSSF